MYPGLRLCTGVQKILPIPGRKMSLDACLRIIFGVIYWKYMYFWSIKRDFSFYFWGFTDKLWNRLENYMYFKIIKSHFSKFLQIILFRMWYLDVKTLITNTSAQYFTDRKCVHRQIICNCHSCRYNRYGTSSGRLFTGIAWTDAYPMAQLWPGAFPMAQLWPGASPMAQL